MDELVKNFKFVVRENYFNMKGRARRREYWLFYLAYWIGCGVFGLVAYFSTWIGYTLLILWVSALFIPTFTAAVRRVHDANYSAWILLTGLIPYAGGFFLLGFLCIPGTPGPNRFGADPLGRPAPAVPEAAGS